MKKDGAPLANFGELCTVARRKIPRHDIARSRCSIRVGDALPRATFHSLQESYSCRPLRCEIEPCASVRPRLILQTGSIRSLTDAPLADDAGWIAIGDPSWSNDGREILLPNTFLKSKENAPSRPCVAVMDVSSGASTCVEVLKAHKTETSVEEGYHLVLGARFAGGTGQVMVAFITHEDQSFRTTRIPAQE